MRTWLLWFSVGAVAMAGGATWTWPRVVYKGKARDVDWLREKFDEFKTRLVCVEGLWGDRTRPLYNDPEIGNCTTLRGHVARILAEGEVLLTVRVGWFQGNQFIPGSPGRLVQVHVAGIDTKKLVDDAWWEGVVMCVGKREEGGETLVSSRPIPAKVEPLTPQQFVDALATGVRLVHVEKRRINRGSGRYPMWKWEIVATPVE